MIDEQNFVCIIVKISIQDFIVPVEAISMESVSESSTIDRILATSLRPLVGCPVSAPMKCRTESFRPSSICLWIANISTTLHDVYLPTSWPPAIFKESGHHPDCRPKPVTLGQFSPYFYPSIGECKRLNCCHFSTDDRRKVIDSI